MPRGRIPPRKHLLKVERRLARLEKMALHEILRPSQRFNLPSKAERQRYMEVHDKLLGEDLPALLDALLGRDREDYDPTMET